MVLLISLCSLSACNSQNEKPNDDNESKIIKQVSSNEDFRLLNRIDNIETQLIGYDSKGLYISDEYNKKAEVIVKQSGVNSVIYKSGIILFSSVIKKNSAAKPSTVLYASEMKNGNKVELATIRQSNLSLLGLYDNKVYFIGNYNNDFKNKACISYSLKTKKTQIETEKIQEAQLFDKNLVFFQFQFEFSLFSDYNLCMLCF